MPFDASAMTDDALLRAYANGAGWAGRALTDRLAPKAWRTALRLLGDADEAEDVTQEAMIRLWRIAPDWQEGRAQVSTWLYRVTVNLATDRLRRGTRQVALEAVPEPQDARPGAAERMTQADRAAALEAALSELPERQRQAVVLRHLEGLANPEIAEILELSVEAVESLTARGKRRLAAILGGRKDELGYDDD